MFRGGDPVGHPKKNKEATSAPTRIQGICNHGPGRKTKSWVWGVRAGLIGLQNLPRRCWATPRPFWTASEADRARPDSKYTRVPATPGAQVYPSPSGSTWVCHRLLLGGQPVHDSERTRRRLRMLFPAGVLRCSAVACVPPLPFSSTSHRKYVAR